MIDLVRYVLFRRDGEIEPEELVRISRIPSLRIVEPPGPRALLVEAPDSALAQLRAALPGWAIEREIVHAAPRPSRLPRPQSPP